MAEFPDSLGRCIIVYMTTPNERDDEDLQVLETVKQHLESLLTTIRSVDAKVEAQGIVTDAISANLDAQRRVIDAQGNLIKAVSDAHEGEAAVLDVLGQWMTDLDTKFQGIRNDLALVKGGHARSAMLHNMSKIADGFGFHFISEMPQQALIEFANVAGKRGMGDGDVESFKNADAVAHITDNNGDPGYLAIEASFTVSDNDVRRATRNAGCLNQYTGLPAYGAVVGVEALAEAQAAVDEGRILFYKIQPGEMQPE